MRALPRPLISLRAVLGLALTAAIGPVSAGPLSVHGREIVIDGQRFVMKGVCYSPNPIGHSGADSPRSDFYTRKWRDIYRRDLPRMREMGVNCVRVYGWGAKADHREFLDHAWNGGRQPIRVLISTWIDPQTDWTSRRAVSRLKTEWSAIARNSRKHPAVLGYLVGNELNQAPGNLSLHALWPALDEIAAAIRRVDDQHLISTALSDSELLVQLQLGERLATNLNAWCVQTYRGSSFKTLFADYARISGKPLFVSEFGVDAFDGPRRQEFPDNARVPAEWVLRLWTELRANDLIASGGAVFAWSDEWWKAGRPSSQDAGGWWNGAFPDGQANEEWWGIHRVRPGKPDVLEPRALFDLLKAAWTTNAASTLIP
jgi:hypothetical protein